MFISGHSQITVHPYTNLTIIHNYKMKVVLDNLQMIHFLLAHSCVLQNSTKICKLFSADLCDNSAYNNITIQITYKKSMYLVKYYCVDHLPLSWEKLFTRPVLVIYYIKIIN
ncbi:hypothetical protein OTU49_005933 [Cherax quadricarinatus]|uniref:Uncharacterized protein n=1 Tax=Cherax quadricarinatus TaxID=27406 RepID=A0AAW0YL44_CHEQU